MEHIIFERQCLRLTAGILNNATTIWKIMKQRKRKIEKRISGGFVFWVGDSHFCRVSVWREDFGVCACVRTLALQLGGFMLHVGEYLFVGYKTTPDGHSYDESTCARGGRTKLYRGNMMCFGVDDVVIEGYVSNVQLLPLLWF